MLPVNFAVSTTEIKSSNPAKPPVQSAKSDTEFSKALEKADNNYEEQPIRSEKPEKDDDKPTDEATELLGAVNNAIQDQQNQPVDEPTEEVSSVEGSSDPVVDAVSTQTDLTLPTVNNVQSSQGSGDETFVSVLEGTTKVSDNVETMARTPETSELSTSEVTKSEAVHDATAAATRSLENVNEPLEENVRPVEVKTEGQVNSDTAGENVVVTPTAQTKEQSADTASSGDTDGENDTAQDSGETSEVDTPEFELAPKQVHATETFRENTGVNTNQATAQTQTVPVNQLYDKIVESAQFIHGSESDTMTLQLKPEHLGKVEIQIVLSAEGALKLKVTAEDINVRGMLNSQIGQLVDSLNSKGLRIEGAEVVYSGLESDMFNQNSDRHSQNNGDGNTSRKTYRSMQSIDGGSSGFGYESYWVEEEEVTEYIA